MKTLLAISLFFGLLAAGSVVRADPTDPDCIKKAQAVRKQVPAKQPVDCTQEPAKSDRTKCNADGTAVPAK